jgi:predicted DNA-binding transcriptional regulator AlpA
MPNLITAERQRRVSRAINNVAQAPQPALPTTGIMTWDEVKPFVPFSRRSLSIYMNNGQFPRGTVISGRLCWRAEAIRQWIDEVLPLAA